ncbi:hypothetical protein JOF41_007346 [Saccharothrix coeruleofusca]|uniref:hypothetical protein n=1 Tax=Saccharothrix coeruleofusca TaxID=33919 RepID=UPI001AE1FEDB|nr:hypothetical protein [Saccharothrix coeruleofusca]MBP2341092.1 hypothetical protein [Saccharothrix coeruleofusca]
MNNTTTDATLSDVDLRHEAFRRATELHPDATAEETMRLAEWLLTGSVLLDPTRLETAARAAIEMDGRNWDNCGPATKASYVGQAARVVTHYLAGGAR